MWASSAENFPEFEQRAFVSPRVRGGAPLELDPAPTFQSPGKAPLPAASRATPARRTDRETLRRTAAPSQVDDDIDTTWSLSTMTRSQTLSRPGRAAVIAVAALAVTLLAGCGGKKDRPATQTA